MMMPYNRLLFLQSILCCCFSSLSAHKIWPAALVEEYTNNEPSEILRTIRPAEFDFFYENSNVHSTDPILVSAQERFRKRVSNLVPTKDTANEYPVNPQAKVLSPLRGVHVNITSFENNKHVRTRQQVDQKSTTISTPPHGVDESYEIVIPGHTNPDSSLIVLTAPTVYGVLRGLTSLTQLFEFGWFEPDGAGEGALSTATFVIHDTPLRIQDAPVYHYRGLLIDTSRHYLPLELILHNLDAMEMNKMNVLHWHITDSPSWPYKSRTHPELSDKGAYCDACIYTPENVQTVLSHAALRGIRVVPEFDLPGHCQAIGKSHPEFLTDCGGSVRQEPLDVTQTATMDWVYELYTEISQLWTDEYMHIGGDEIPTGCWNKSPSVQKWMKQHNMTQTVELLTFFENELIHYISQNLTKKAVVWQELFDLGVDLPLADTIIDVWKGNKLTTREEATLRGFQVIQSGGWYLDHLGDDWWTLYQIDPRNFNGTVAQKKLVIGGHASMWGERVDETNFLPRVWPRASSPAEKLWAGNLNLPRPKVQPRLEKFRCYMVEQGFPASPIAPGSCKQKHRTMMDPAVNQKEGKGTVTSM